MLIAHALLEELLMGVRLEELSVVEHLVRSDLIPNDRHVLVSVELAEARHNSSRQSLATNLQRFLWAEQRQCLRRLPLLTVSDQKQALLPMIDPVPAGLELRQKLRDHRMRDETTLSGLQCTLHSTDLALQLEGPGTFDQDLHIL